MSLRKIRWIKICLTSGALISIVSLLYSHQVAVYSLATARLGIVQSSTLTDVQKSEDLESRGSKERSGYGVPEESPGTSQANYTTHGYHRAEFLRSACLKPNYKPARKGKRIRVSYDNGHKVLFCPMCKLASTFWTRMYKVWEFNEKGNLADTPFDIPIKKAPASKQYYDLSTGKISPGLSDAGSSFKFLFVRNPFERLFSAFVDRLVGPVYSFWIHMGLPPIKQFRDNKTKSCGHDVTFEEFLKYIVYTDKNHKELDCHWAKYGICRPCQTNYSFVGQMETLEEDTNHILYKLNQTSTIDALRQSSHHYYIDAVDHVIRESCKYKKVVQKCISWDAALRRAWRKLQIRGIIGSDPYPLSEVESRDIRETDFIKLAASYTGKSSAEELAWQRQQAFLEAYRAVPVDVLEDIVKVYLDDFVLFGYNMQPDELFNRKKSFQYYGFMNYTEDLYKKHHIRRIIL